MVFRRGLAAGRLVFSSTSARPMVRCLPLLLAALFAAARPAHAVTQASILVDARTGQVLESSNADALAHPASLTKLMTLYLTFQRLERGQITLDTELYVSRHAAWQSPTKLWLRPGGNITVQSAIFGITTVSANDAAVVLAENLGGSEPAFVDLMNQEARRLGMTNTTFCNASGLPNYDQWTTARDMSTLALALIHTFPQYYHFFSAPDFAFHGRMVDGHDWLLDEYPGVDGMKTGYIYSSGFNIVTSAMRDDRRLVGVVLGGRTARTRDVQMMALLNEGFSTPATAAPLVASAAPPAVGSDAAPQPAPAVPVPPVRAQTRRAAAVRIRPAAYHPAFDREHTWTIQVGAGFRSEYWVHRELSSARRSAPTPLRRGRAEVVRLRRADYLARFADLTYPMAERACSALHARSMSCRILPHPAAHHGEIVNAAAAAILPTGE